MADSGRVHQRGGAPACRAVEKELQIFTGRDLLMLFPYRYYDRSEITPIARLTSEQEYAQVKGVITQIHQVEGGRWSNASRLVAELHDDTGFLQLIWFNGWQWVKKPPIRQNLSGFWPTFLF